MKMWNRIRRIKRTCHRRPTHGRFKWGKSPIDSFYDHIFALAAHDYIIKLAASYTEGDDNA